MKPLTTSMISFQSLPPFFIPRGACRWRLVPHCPPAPIGRPRVASPSHVDIAAGAGILALSSVVVACDVHLVAHSANSDVVVVTADVDG